jgi:hypothetical protein
MPWSSAPCANRPLQSPEGKVIGRCVSRHRHQEFIRFVATVERSVPAEKVIHAILTTMPPINSQVLAWLAEHP